MTDKKTPKPPVKRLTKAEKLAEQKRLDKNRKEHERRAEKRVQENAKQAVQAATKDVVGDLGYIISTRKLDNGIVENTYANGHVHGYWPEKPSFFQRMLNKLKIDV